MCVEGCPQAPHSTPADLHPSPGFGPDVSEMEKGPDLEDRQLTATPWDRISPGGHGPSGV